MLLESLGMRRETFLVLGAVMLVFWAGIYYVLSLHQQPGGAGAAERLGAQTRS